MKHTDRSQSRRVTPWDDILETTPSQNFIQKHYREHYMQRHPKLDETGEVELINSYIPGKCPYCTNTAFQKYGHTRIGVQRYKCKNAECGQTFLPTTGTIFDEHRISMRDGEFVGGRAPYGYKKAPDNCHKLIIDEEPAKAVRQIFQWAYNNVAISEITRRLNDAGIATPSHYKQATGELKHQNLIGNGKWQTRTILRILDSPVYTGDLVQGRTKTVDHTQLRADTDNYITVRNTHEAIISHDIFDEVQRIRLQSRRECKEKPVNEYTPNIFKGKIFCAHCGKHLNRMCKRRITRADVYRFYCITNNRIAHGSCPGVSIREDELIPSVIAIMEKELSVALSDSLPTRKAEMTQQTERAEIQTQLSLKRQDLANSQRLIRGLYEDVVQGLLSSEDYFSMKEGYEQRVEQLTAEITALNNRIVEFDKQLSLYQDMHNDALTLESNHTLTAELIDRLIERIEVNHDKELTIVFRFQTDYAKVVTE